MKAFLQSIQLLLRDLASSLVFVVLLAITHNPALAACFGMVIGVGQIALQFARRKPIDTMEWLSLFLVIASGAATILTSDPRFVLFKPSAIYTIIGILMLKPGWMNRYLPKIAQTVAPDIATYVGFAWAGLMFISAALNAWLALTSELATWAVTMSTFGIASKMGMFVGGFLAIRLIARHRIRAIPAEKRAALLESTGWTAAQPSRQQAP